MVKRPSAVVLDRLVSNLVDGLHEAARKVSTPGAHPDTRSVLRIVTGKPSDVELAALLAVLAAASSPQNVPHPPMSPLGEWGAPPDQHRYGLGHAPAVFVHARYSR